MSILSDFTKAAFGISGDIIGRESLIISGGAAVTGIMNEATFSREYESGGFEQSASMDFVTGIEDFMAAYPLEAKNYEGKAATARGEDWRVITIRPGASFVTISLGATNQSGS
jgi:hypothetical protein